MSKTSKHNIRRVAILFSGGAAPSANAVISSAAVAFNDHGIEVLGIKHGYSNLMEFGPDRPMVEGEDYFILDSDAIRRTRGEQGIIIGTARANPGKLIKSRADMDKEECTAPLKTVYEALDSLGVDALMSLGGDDTLKTANKMQMFQDLNEVEKKIPVIHLPKTIDNDYFGIDFTFGYFTAVDFLATEIRNLLYDGQAARAYFLVEAMGRSAGWLAYGASIAGEASMVLSVEDIEGDLATTETVTLDNGKTIERKIMNYEKIMEKIVEVMLVREKQGKEYGVIVMAEGLAELMPWETVKDVHRDEFGHLSIADVDLAKRFSRLVKQAYTAATGKERKMTGVQLGYECRCTRPHAFDIMLGSQLGVGAYRALCEEGVGGVMVSVHGLLELDYVPFAELVDQETLVTKVRHIEPGSDFHTLARFLETNIPTDE